MPWFGTTTEYHPADYPMYKNAGDYEIKVLQNGKIDANKLSSLWVQTEN
jgi:hypothetical protein